MKHISFTLLTLLFICISQSTIGSTVYNVKEYGAKGDGISLDSDAINKAIETAANNGGGTIFFPAGNYLSFSIRLKSNIRLHLETGCTLTAASPDNFPGLGYDIPDSNFWGDSLKYQDFGHSHWKNSLIWGIGLENIIIEGFGLINGEGLIKWGKKKPGLGNKTIALKNCKNVTIRDISILKGGHFGILPTGVVNFTIDNVKIDSNRDGINIDCCKNVIISNCFVNTPNDDAIVLKSSYALGRPEVTENITITNCQVSGYEMGSMLNGTFTTNQIFAPDSGGVTGRIKIGTESNGGFRNITISNCTFSHCRGLAIETVDGAFIEDVVINNITMTDIINAPFYIRLGARMRGPESLSIGSINRIIISNISITGVPNRYAALILGSPGYNIQNISFNNIFMTVSGGATKEQSEIEVPEDTKDYPDPRNHGLIPANGFLIRHATDISFNNINISCLEEDKRPAYILSNVSDFNIYNSKSTNTTSPAFVISKSKNIQILNYNKIKNTNLKSCMSKCEINFKD